MSFWETDHAILKNIHSVQEVNLTPKNESSHMLYHTLCYKKEGISRHVTATEEILLHPGEILFLPKDVPYKVSVVEPGSSIAVCFELLEDGMAGKDFQLIQNRNPEQCYNMFEKLLHLESEPGSRYDRFAVFYALLSLLYKQTNEASLPPQIQTAVSYILHHYASPDLCEKKLAELCGYSMGYFRRIFTRFVGCSPVRYIISVRMQRALTYLQSGFFTVTQTAEQVGYRDLYYFSNSFKREFGCSPTQYLRELEQNRREM